jgi:S-adenosylmethionine:tRNA ribosyltransferase-isomerase
MDVEEFDYELPTELIAQHPPARRGASRLMVLHRREGGWEHRRFRDLPAYLKPGDLLVLNDTRVMPARLVGRRRTGGLVRCLLVEEREPGCWQALVEARGGLQAGEELDFDEGATGQLVGRAEAGGWWLRFPSGDIADLLARIGRAPLPPYIKRTKANDPFRVEDLRRYQTVFARRPGAIAAPTAGLHFSPAMLHRLRQAGVPQATVTLHVGVGTFQPIRTRRVEEHRMHREWVSVSEETVSAVRSARSGGCRVVACGTTVVRALESSVRDGALQPFTGFTELFITPGCGFHAVDVLLTNFHLPRSTLLLLVSAFAGKEFIREAYAEAVRERYRFYSYGDAMLIL